MLATLDRSASGLIHSQQSVMTSFPLMQVFGSTDTAELCLAVVGLQEEAMTATTGGDPAREGMTAEATRDMRGDMTGATPLSGAMTELGTHLSMTAMRGGRHPRPMGVLCNPSVSLSVAFILAVAVTVSLGWDRNMQWTSSCRVGQL